MAPDTFEPVPLKQLIFTQGGRSTIYTQVFLNFDGSDYIITEDASVENKLCDLVTLDGEGSFCGTHIDTYSWGASKPCFVRLTRPETFQLKTGDIQMRFGKVRKETECLSSLRSAVPRILERQ
jgi:hypothetical protein